MKTSVLSFLSLLTVGVRASPILSERATVTSTQLTNMKLYAQYAGAAYCNSGNTVGTAITCTSGVCDTVTSNKATTLATFAGPVTDIEGFVAVDPTNKQIIVSFRGSHSVRNWIADILFLESDCDLFSGCSVHSGFLDAWNEVSSTVLAAVKSAHATYSSYSIIVTGHSLGGAVGTLAGAYLRAAGYTLDIWSYGSPRVGNSAFATFVSNQAGSEMRVTHLDDPVPRLPPLLFGYRHTTPEYWLSDGSSTTTTYAISDIVVCTGTANTDCNAGTSGFDVTAHLYYLDDIAGCGTGFSFKRQTTTATNMTDAELEARLSMLAELDVQYAAALAASS